LIRSIFKEILTRVLEPTAGRRSSSSYSWKPWVRIAECQKKTSKARPRRTEAGHAEWNRKTRQRASARYRNRGANQNNQRRM